MDGSNSFLKKVILKFFIIILIPVYAHQYVSITSEVFYRHYGILWQYETSSGWGINEMVFIVLPLVSLFSIPGIFFDYKLQSTSFDKSIWMHVVAFSIIILAGPYSLYFLFISEGPIRDMIGANFFYFTIIVSSSCVIITTLFIFYPILEKLITLTIRNQDFDDSKNFRLKISISSLLLGIGFFVVPYEFVIESVYEATFTTTGFSWHIRSWFSPYDGLSLDYYPSLYPITSPSIWTFVLYMIFAKFIADYFKGTQTMKTALIVGVLGMISALFPWILFALMLGGGRYLPIPMPFTLLLGYLSMWIGKEIRSEAIKQSDQIWTSEPSESKQNNTDTIFLQ